jgi:hypothetical protein
MEEHVAVMKDQGIVIPKANPDPQVLIHNSGEFRAA